MYQHHNVTYFNDMISQPLSYEFLANNKQDDKSCVNIETILHLKGPFYIQVITVFQQGFDQ